MPQEMTCLRGVAAAALFCLGCLPELPHEDVDAAKLSADLGLDTHAFDPQATDGSVPPVDTSTSEAISEADAPEVAETRVVDSGPPTNECGGRPADARRFCGPGADIADAERFMILSSQCALADLSATCPALKAVRVIDVYETQVPGWIELWATAIGVTGGGNGTASFIFDPCAETITCKAVGKVHIVPGGHYAIALHGCNGPAAWNGAETGFCQAFEYGLTFTPD